MERRLAQFRAARRPPQPTAAPASERRAGPEPGLGPRDRPAQVSGGGGWGPRRTPPRPSRDPGAAAGTTCPGPRGSPAQGLAPPSSPPTPLALAPQDAARSHVAVLKVLLWLVLLGLAAELQFGLPCFVLSLFYWLYAGTRGPGQRRPGERSAYSVFNPGCRAIQGALTAEQLERELRYAPAAGR
uniref:SAYSVFN motif domain containing 1 n=1 Tax=Chelydra serpentina TaxID=8475 RepID=A0A8C3SJB8_CHESE